MFAHFSFTAAASKEYVDLSKKRKFRIIFTSPKNIPNLYPKLLHPGYDREYCHNLRKKI